MKPVSFILNYIQSHKYRYFAGILTLLVVDFLNLLVPKYTGTITDGLQSRTMELQGVTVIVVKIAIICLLITLGRFGFRYFLFGASRKIECELRNDMFGHLEKLSVEYYNEHKTGDLMSRFTNDLNAVRMSIGPAVITTIDATVMTLMVIVQMIIYVNWKLTLLAVIPLFFIAFSSYFYGKAAEVRFAAKQEAYSHMTDQVQESISGVRVIKAFVQERAEIKEFAKSNQRNMDKNMQVVKLQAWVIPMLDFIIGVSSLITLLYGGYTALTGEITLGRFVAFNQYIGMLIWPMIAVGDSITFFSQGMASLKRIKEVLDEKPEIFDGSEVKQVSDIQGDLEFRNLTFTHQGHAEPTLDKITLHVPAGSTLAIIGRTGNGKSTIVNLLLRLYTIKPEMIFIDGKDINTIPLKMLRENISYVPQDNFLFSDTLYRNIAFGVEDYEQEDIYDAANAACIHSNIIEFPEGYETIVGERGVTLSGGQKQRSSIARALVKDSPILILDDALSAVDTKTEELILDNLKQNRNGKTTILIAHRISTIQNADCILVLEDGKAAEYGTHEQLLAMDGIYKGMFEKQQLESLSAKEG